MAKTIAVVNQKGGVGKTTSCVNLAAALAEKGRRILLCDFDPQANATSGMGVDKTNSLGIYGVIINGVPIDRAIVHTRYGDVLPSSKALAGAGIEMIERQKREFLLRDALAGIKANYDFIFIDCPPSLELLTLNALCAADSVFVPVQCEYYALEGLSDLMNTLRLVRRSLNPALQLEGVLLTMFDSRTNLAMQVAEEVKRYFPGKVYGTVVPRNVRLSEAPSHGKPVTAYDRTSRGCEAYLALADEFLGAWEKGNFVPVKAVTNPVPPTNLRRKKDIEQVHISLGYPALNQYDKRNYALALLNNAFGGATSSRLFQRIREEKGLAYSVYSYPGSYADCGVLTVYAGTSPENAELVGELLREEAALLAEKGLTENEFRMGKEQLKASLILGSESNSARMHSIGRRMLIFGDTRTDDEIIQRLNAITLEEINHLAYEIFSQPCAEAIVGND